MLMADEYEIFPHKILEDLKYDVEALKKKLTEPDTTAQELVAEMEDLKTTIKELNNVFKDALQDIKEEDSAKLLFSLQNKIEAVTTQNETIARGMVAISDKLEEFMESHKKVSGRLPANSPLRSSRITPPVVGGLPPTPSGSSRMAPPPPELTGGSAKAPPLPPEVKPKRRGFFK